MKRNLFCIFFVCLLPATGLCQDTASKMQVRNIIWVTPVAKNTVINGLALGYLQAMPWMKADSLKINGVNVDASIFCILGGFYAVIGTLFSPFGKPDSTKFLEHGALGSRFVFVEETADYSTRFKGLSIGAGGIVSDAMMQGLAINGVCSFADVVNGFEITGVMNLHYSFHGLMIAGLRNKVTTGKGMQIGLINTCKQGQVFQIGLINRIGKRVIPFINFSCKKLKKILYKRFELL